MDFNFSDEEQTVAELGRKILEDHATNERQKEIEAGDAPWDADLYKALADANLLGTGLPEAYGGSELGFLAVCLLLSEIGRTVAPLPAFPALVLGGLPVAEFGSDEQQKSWLPGVVDGSAAILMASEEYAKAHGLEPRARIVATANMGDCPTLMLNAPVPATRKVLERAGMTLDDIDIFEVNEAFAVVSEKFQRDLGLDRDKVNVNGGAMALGHPIGATGAILIGTVLDELERQDKQTGLITMCAGGGMAPAIIIERV